VESDPTRPAEVDAPGRTNESRELGEPAARLARLDRRELRADLVGEAQSRTPSSRSRRRL
jgi:hypothetical protein